MGDPRSTPATQLPINSADAMDQLDDLLRTLATTDGGTDLHLKVGSPPRLRVKGVLEPLIGYPDLDKTTLEAIAAAILPPSAGATFAERNEAECAYALDGVGRFRVAAYRQRGSATLIFRRLQSVVASVGELNLPFGVRQLAAAERGLVLVAGPGGSGRTTTLAAMVDHLNHTRACHVVTVEDPVEVLHRDRMAAISQREVGRDVPTVAAGVTTALRHDPDVIVVGRLEEPLAVEAAIAAAESGCLVLGAVVGSEVSDAVRRLVGSFPADQHQQMRLAVAGVLAGATCQRLVPRADGTGRVPAVEVLLATSRTQLALVTGDDAALRAEMAAGTGLGMQTLDQALANLLEDGAIDLRGAMAATANWPELRRNLDERGQLDADPATS